MMKKARLVKKIAEVKHFPNKRMFKCQFVKDDTTWEADILPEEYALVMAIQSYEKKCLFASDIDKLFNLVEDFGQAKWIDGADDAETEW